ncbi:hypothetical protein LCGC14_0431630 [marine sediment metagenome]|uniref:Uncharacterized protein n=1 Tax=marine sediment metagenome TaxID=412755 RepID=A0A0F9VXE6_9ZZZZ|nr:hypothetical protein [Phycisphaerae bacterium]HDZ42994.1 hypothetical protein [Phycisphaerae bacterium]
MRRLRSICRLFAAVAAGALIGACGPQPGGVAYGPARREATLTDPRIHESSGLAVSRRTPGVFWTHNDSGDPPQLFAIDRQGRTLATVTITGAENVDWEDLASYELHGQAYLLIADVGDNNAQRDRCQLYIVPEPAVDPAQVGRELSAEVQTTIEFRYPDGPRDCEAVAVDTTSVRPFGFSLVAPSSMPVQVSAGVVCLVSKTVLGPCGVYILPLPPASHRGRVKAVLSGCMLRLPGLVDVPVRIASPWIPMVTAMDISPDGRRAIVADYGNATEYVRRDGESWAGAFRRGGGRVQLPRRRQGESICYDADGKTLVLTSEGPSSPLWIVPAAEDEDSPREP